MHRLDELGIEHGEIQDAHYGSGVSFRDPDGIGEYGFPSMVSEGTPPAYPLRLTRDVPPKS